MTISNASGDVHPMHLHGHHAVVLSRNGVPSTGSPWWTDSLDVADGDTFEVAFVADNPASGWTTATTSSTPPTGWSPTSPTPG